MSATVGRVRGIGLLGVIQGLRLQRQEAEARLPDSLKPYLDRKILAGNWYSEEDHAQLLAIVADIYSRPGSDVWRWMGKLVATMNLASVYSHLLVQGDVEASFLRLPEIWRRYRDTGLFEVEMVGNREGRVRLSNYQYLSDGFCRLMAGYIGQLLILAGAEDCKVEIVSQDADAGRAEWALSWQV